MEWVEKLGEMGLGIVETRVCVCGFMWIVGPRCCRSAAIRESNDCAIGLLSTRVGYALPLVCI